ncbi:MAG: hypothetical protein GXP27_12245 [Planctomycetes bacterium]|nr:hypothetical protein [Planctomycetota bacterium]
MRETRDQQARAFGPVRRINRWLVFGALACLPCWSGCAALHPLDGLPARYLPDEYKAPSRSGRKTIDLSLLAQTPPAEYRVDSGDVLGIYILNLLGRLDQAPPVYFPQREEVPPSMGFPIPVRDDGTISLPLVGALYVRGMTLHQIEDRIRKALIEERRILNKDNANVFVSLQKPRFYRVLVIRQEAGTDLLAGGGTQFNLGALKRGTGRVVNLPAYRNDVLHALAETGGLPGLDAENTIYVIRNSRRRRPRAAPAAASSAPGESSLPPAAELGPARSSTPAVPNAVPQAPRPQSWPQANPGQRPVWPAGPQNPPAVPGRPLVPPAPERPSPSKVHQTAAFQTVGFWNRPGPWGHSTTIFRLGAQQGQLQPTPDPSFPPPPDGTFSPSPRPELQAQPELQRQVQPQLPSPTLPAQPQVPPADSYGTPPQPAAPVWPSSPRGMPSAPQPHPAPAPWGSSFGGVPAPFPGPPASPGAASPESSYDWPPAAPPTGTSSTIPAQTWNGSFKSPPAGFEWLSDDDTVQNSRITRIPVRLAPGEKVRFTEEDIILGDGDIVFIESRDTEIFYTGGLLGGGQYTLPRDYDLDVLGAIAIAQAQTQGQAGGGGNFRSIAGPSALNQDVSVSASQVIVLRQLPDGTQLPIEVDLYRAMRDPAERILIQPGDYIILQYRPLEAVAAFFERYILESAIFGLAVGQVNR